MTTIENSEPNGIIGLLHDFGNGITVVTDFEKRTTTRYHGEIEVEQYQYAEDLTAYTKLMQSIESSIAKKAQT